MTSANALMTWWSFTRCVSRAASLALAVSERGCTATGRGKFAGEGDGGRRRGGRLLGVPDLERPSNGFDTGFTLCELPREPDLAPARARG